MRPLRARSGAPSFRRGAAIIYMTVCMPVVIGFLVLAVDFGRIEVAKTQLQTAADAAARYAASGVASSSGKSAIALSCASAVCAQSTVDTGKPACTSANVTTGFWDTTTRTFTASTSDPAINAVRINLTYVPGSAGSPPMFIQALGGGPMTIHATSIAMETIVSTTVTAPSQGNLWLAGMPDNTLSTDLQGDSTKYDYNGTSANPKQRPTEIDLSTLNVSPGDIISFDGISGVASNGGGTNTMTNADGQTNYLVALGAAPASTVPITSMNGISNALAPLSAFMAVFMNDNAPNTTNAPSALDFGSTAARNYTSISPLLKQTFFVGDGKTDSDQIQYITVPAGATRIFLGMMDAWQWNDNLGSFTMTIYHAPKITTVK